MKLRPYQEEAYHCTLKKFETVDSALCVLATGLGKCFAKDTPVLMYDGNIVKVQDIEKGDFLMGPDSNPREVISLARGREMMYRITPKKGDSYTVNESHILSLKLTPGRKNYNHRVNAGDGKIYEDGDIANICVKDYLKSSKTFKHRAKGYRIGVEFPRSRDRLYTPPYILGLWLGDGASRRPQITTADAKIVAELQKYATSENLKLTKLQQCGKAFTYSISQYTSHPGENPLLVDLQMYHLLQNKHIPLDYKTSSRKERLEILAGILDTDGYFFEGGYEFVNKSKRLAEDTAFVARSLGLAASIKRVFKTCTNNGVTGIYYLVYISGETSIVPCRLKRKQAPKRKQKKDVLVTGIKVEKIGVGDYYGFELSGTDRRFLLGDFAVVHNTVYAAHLINHFRSSGRIMMIAHRAELIYQADDHIQKICEVESDIEMGPEWATSFAEFKADVVISTVQTQVAGREGGRMTRFDPNEFSLLIIDEAHHAPAETYKRIIKYYRQNPALKILGLTATPDRKDKKAMGQIFEEVAYAYDIRDGIDDGWLVPIEQQSVFVEGLDFSSVRTTGGDLNGKDLAEVLEFEEILHGIADPTVQLTGEKKTLIFAASVVHAERLTEIINRHKQHSAQFVCGTTPKDVRRDMFKDFANKEFQYLVNVGVATEGFDDPGIECVVMARPTKSRTLYAQMCLDDKTEILTKSGWVGIDDRPYGFGSRIANYDMVSKRITWENATHFIRRKIKSSESYYGIMSPSLDILVTNEHDMVVKQRRGRKHKWGEYEKLTAAQTANLRDSYKIPIAGYLDAKGVPLSDNELRFIGWVMTDGTINRRTKQITITQAEHQPWLDEIEKCLIGCGFKYSKYIKDRKSQFKRTSKTVIFTVSFGKPRGRDKHLRGWGALENSLSKDFSLGLDDINRKQLAVLLEAIHLGDGKKEVKSGYIRRSYHISTANNRFADKLQMLCVTRGFKCNKSIVIYPGKSILFYLHIKNTTERTIGGKKSKDRPIFKKTANADYRDVWCVTVPTGAIIIRRYGKVSIVGNCGRGTRPLPGIVDLYPGVVERREAIAASDKTHLEIMDFVGNAGRHKLVTAADILGGRYTDEIVELAKENAEKDSNESKKPVDICTELQKAEREIAKRHQMAEDAIARDHLLLRAKYSTAKINPFNIIDIDPKREAPWHKGRPPTSGQEAYLEKCGVDTDGLTFTHASQIIDSMIKRREQGILTYKQAKVLQSRGLDTTDMPFAEANKLITELVRNRWITPARWKKELTLSNKRR